MDYYVRIVRNGNVVAESEPLSLSNAIDKLGRWSFTTHAGDRVLVVEAPGTDHEAVTMVVDVVSN